MKPLPFLALLICFLTQCATSYNVYDSTPEQSAVRRDFNQFKRNFNNRNTTALLSFISSGTTSEASKTRSLAISGSKAQIQKLPVSQQYEIYFLRHTLGKQQIQQRSAKETYVYLLSKIYSPILIHLGPIQTNGNKAFAKTVRENKPTPYGISFVKENDLWKSKREDQRPLIDSGYHVLKESLGESYERIFAVTLAEKTGRQPSPSIFR